MDELREVCGSIERGISILAGTCPKSGISSVPSMGMDTDSAIARRLHDEGHPSRGVSKPILLCTKSSGHSGSQLGWHIESNLGWHFLRPKVRGIYENVEVSNTPQTFEGFMRWLGMNEDTQFFTSCMHPKYKMIGHSQILCVF